MSQQLDMIQQITQNTLRIMNPTKRHYTRLIQFPQEVMVKIFSLIHPYRVVRYRLLARAFNECLTSKFFALANLKTCAPEVLLHSNDDRPSVPASAALFLLYRIANTTLVSLESLSYNSQHFAFQGSLGVSAEAVTLDVPMIESEIPSEIGQIKSIQSFYSRIAV
ncbi:hypothetical protein BDR26DRAFT_1004728 [Obelidium mucronatum]|nr:hypothetical protein BDR26DRAFT_1004728 [Obelidium mucronatum]